VDPQIHRYATAQQQAYDFVREAILSGTYPGGSRIDIPQVARSLGMSRMPVREALRQLEAEGLVTIRPNRGAVVTVLTPDDVVELFSMRAVLEGLAARLAVPRLDAEALEELEHLLARMDRSAGNLPAWLRNHNAFHDSIARRSGRARLAAQVELLRRAVEPYLRVHAGTYESEEILGAEHRLLLDVLRARDPRQAEAAAREHVERAGQAIVDAIKRAALRPAVSERSG